MHNWRFINPNTTIGNIFFNHAVRIQDIKGAENTMANKKETTYNFQDLPNLGQLFLFVPYLLVPPI